MKTPWDVRFSSQSTRVAELGSSPTKAPLLQHSAAAFQSGMKLAPALVYTSTAAAVAALRAMLDATQWCAAVTIEWLQLLRGA